MTVQFVLSAEMDFDEPHEILNNNGYRILRGLDVSESASDTLFNGGRFIVIAHGTDEGALTIHADNGGRDWLWVGMDNPPIDSRIYVYACHVGKLMVPFLSECEAFGHISPVPTLSSDETDDYVKMFLDRVYNLVSNEQFDRNKWQETLIQLVDSWLAEESIDDDLDDDDVEEFPANAKALFIIHMLRKSLNFGDPMWS